MTSVTDTASIAPYSTTSRGSHVSRTNRSLTVHSSPQHSSALTYFDPDNPNPNPSSVFYDDDEHDQYHYHSDGASDNDYGYLYGSHSQSDDEYYYHMPSFRRPRPSRKAVRNSLLIAGGAVTVILAIARARRVARDKREYEKLVAERDAKRAASIARREEHSRNTSRRRTTTTTTRKRSASTGCVRKTGEVLLIKANDSPIVKSTTSCSSSCASLPTAQRDEKHPRFYERQTETSKEMQLDHLISYDVPRTGGYGPKRTCEVCDTSMPESKFSKPTPACTHDASTCRRCLRRWFVAHRRFEGTPCMASGCSCVVRIADAALWVPAALRARYVRNMHAWRERQAHKETVQSEGERKIHDESSSNDNDNDHVCWTVAKVLHDVMNTFDHSVSPATTVSLAARSPHPLTERTM